MSSYRVSACLTTVQIKKEHFWVPRNLLCFQEGTLYGFCFIFTVWLSKWVKGIYVVTSLDWVYMFQHNIISVEWLFETANLVGTKKVSQGCFNCHFFNMWRHIFMCAYLYFFWTLLLLPIYFYYIFKNLGNIEMNYSHK